MTPSLRCGHGQSPRDPGRYVGRNVADSSCSGSTNDTRATCCSVGGTQSGHVRNADRVNPPRESVDDGSAGAHRDDSQEPRPRTCANRSGDAEGFERLIESLSGDDLYVPVDEVRRSPTTLGSFNILHPESGGKIDVFVRAAGDNFDSARLLRRVRARLLGQDTWVCTAEDIILAKLLWRLETRSERQWQDCAEIASFNDLDVDHMRQWAKKLGVVEDLEDLLTQVKQLEN